MKAIFQRLVVLTLCLACSAAFAKGRNGGGQSSSRVSSRPAVSGGFRQMPRVQAQRPSVNRPPARYIPRQIARQPQIRSVAPSARQSIVPRSRQISRPLPQIAKKYAPSRQAVSRNPILPPPRKNIVTGKSPGAFKPKILPARRGVVGKTAKITRSSGRIAPPVGMVRNSPAVNRFPANPNRIIGTRPPVARPGQNTIAGRRPVLTGSGKWWVGSSANINRNFQYNANWTTHRQYWGYAPWWNRPSCRPWYGGCWNWGWNRPYYDNYSYYNRWYGGACFPGYAVYDNYCPTAWGLLGWSLGSLVYDIGYRTYSNPYPVSAPVVSEGLDVNYTQPLARLAAESAPADDTGVQEITRNSESVVADSQNAFKQRDYLVALELADKAIATSPGDGALHEYRALILFSLGKYGDAAGVLNPVIASGPGWDWATMIALYDTPDTYTGQLRKLEAYTRDKPDSASCHFLLGYHYMVAGHLDLATDQFDLAVTLAPADSVSRELAQLTRATARSNDSEPPVAPAEPKPAPAPVPLEKLTGTWVSTRDASHTITLTFAGDGNFIWNYNQDGTIHQLTGQYSLNDNGLLVLDSKDSQMTATIDLPEDSRMKFILAGGPPADPGLDFTKR